MAPKFSKPSSKHRGQGPAGAGRQGGQREISGASQPFRPNLPTDFFIDPKRIEYVPFVPRNNNQTRVMETIRAHSLTFLVGPAGTAKTFLACAIACEMLEDGLVDGIVTARPAVEAGDSVGFLPGDLNAKIDPYIRPVIDSLSHFLGAPHIFNQLREQGTIETTSMTYVRGRTFQRKVVIFDEMQNATPAQLKMCVTRMGDGSRCIITLDPNQCDLANDIESAAQDIGRFFGLQDIAIIKLTNADVVRSKLVKTILGAYPEERQVS